VGCILGCCSCISHTWKYNTAFVTCRLKKTTRKAPPPSHEEFLQNGSSTRLHMLSVYTSEVLWVKNPGMPVTNVFCPEDIRSPVREVLRMKTSYSKPSRELIRASRTCVLVLSFPCHSLGMHLIRRNG
jgi:hypothetical protein